MGDSGDMVMNRLVLLPLVLPFACLALLSFVAFVGIGAISGALHVIRTVIAALGISGRRDEDPWRGAVGDAHPLEYIEARD
jgi:ABC-type phosphate/phosphonate transport system permease subunit